MDKVYLALDAISRDELFTLLEKNKKEIKNIKIGLELYCKYGKELIHDIQLKYKLNIFLDLKFFDIPNTVYNAIKSLANLNVNFLTIHISGGEQMIEHALAARDKYCPNMKILGVSVLTSFDESDCKKIYNTKLDSALIAFADIAYSSKIDGIICSATDLLILKDYNFLKFCPGIRFEDQNIQDQKRVMSPKEAIINGADFLVMGRGLIKNHNIMKDARLWKDIYSSQ